MSQETVIKVDNLWKRYGLPFVPQARQWVDKLRDQEKSLEAYGPWALKNLNFEVRQGETLGIIGHNGAGKSTLLKLLAGVTPPTQGTVTIEQLIFPMIELNAGLHSEFTGRQNVYMLGAIMGLSRQAISDRIEDIKAFSELDEWFERPVRKYSSGMLTRLGFSVAIYVDADILLVDEVLSVGDITFQRKCFDHMEQLQQDANTTILFVSHSIRQIERLCERSLMLDKGEQVIFGKTGDVIDEYYKVSSKSIIEHRTTNGQRVVGHVFEESLIDIDEIRLLDASGKPATVFQTGDALCVEVSCSAEETYTDVIAGVSVSTVDSFYVSGMSSEASGSFIVSDKSIIRCYIDNIPLMSGIYTINVKLRNLWGVIYGGGYALTTFSIFVDADNRLTNDYGVVSIDASWENIKDPKKTHDTQVELQEDYLLDE